VKQPAHIVVAFLAFCFVLGTAAGSLAASSGEGGAGPPGGPDGGTLDGGYRLLEAAAASVNGEVIFLSDVERKACFYRCGAFPGDAPLAVGLAGARDRHIATVLVLQEQRRLALGEADDAVVQEAFAGARTRMAQCADPCASRVGEEALRGFIARRLLAEDFLKKRISVFVDVSEEEIRSERERRLSRAEGTSREATEEAVREDLLREKTAREIGNWFSRAASQSRILLAPLEEQ
jgi:hypothetical protein